MTVAPLGLFAFFRAASESKRGARVVPLAIALFVVAGALPYLFLFAVAPLSQVPTTWSWGDVHDARSLFEYLSRSDYPASKLQAPSRLGAELARVTTQLAGLPIVASSARRFCGAPVAGVGGRWIALAASAFCAGPLFAAVFHTPLEGMGLPVTERFDLLAMTLLVPAIARAIDELAASLLARSVVAPVVVSVAFVALFLRGWPSLRARHRTGVALYADDALLALPDRAIVLGTNDARFGAFLYAQYGSASDPTSPSSTRASSSPPGNLRARRARARLGAPSGARLDARRRAAPRRHARDGAPGVRDRRVLRRGRARPSYPIGPLIRLVASPADLPSPDDVERANAALADRFAREPLPLPGPEPWSDALAVDFARPWDALANLFDCRGESARAAACRARAAAAREYAWP